MVAMKKNLKVSERIEITGILMSSDYEAVDWLKNHADNSPLSKYSKDIISYCFSRRGNKRLGLAVAQYGTHFLTLKKLLKAGSKTIRLAVLSNAWVGPYRHFINDDKGFLSTDEVFELIKQYPIDSLEVEAVFQNPKLDRDGLATIISSYTDTNDYIILLYIVRHLVQNPILGNRPLNIWEGADHHELNSKLLNLLKTAPADQNWANLLNMMLSSLYIHRIYRPDFDFKILLDKWTEEGVAEEEDFIFSCLRENITETLMLNNSERDITP